MKNCNSSDTERSFKEELPETFNNVLITIKAKLSESSENAKKLKNLVGSMERIQAINVKNWLSDGVVALSDFCNTVEGLKDIMNIEEELDDIDGLLDTIKSISEEIENEDISSFSDLMDAILPVMSILMPLIEYGLKKSLHKRPFFNLRLL